MITLRPSETNRRHAPPGATAQGIESGRDPERERAWKHGLMGEGVVRTEEESGLVAAKMEEWAEFYRPSDPQAAWAVEEAARMSVRIRRCWTHDWTLRMLALERAEGSWDDDRRLAAEEMGVKLKSRPGVIARRLRRTRQGCDWLLVRWEGLAALLRDGREWSEAQRSMALDLLGTPVELRDGPSRIDPPGVEGEALRVARLALAEAEILALRRLRDEALVGLDEHERLSAMMGFAPEFDRSILLLMRHEAAASRRFYRAIEWLRRRRREATDEQTTPPAHRPSPSPTLAPVAPPLPEPTPEPVRDDEEPEPWSDAPIFDVAMPALAPTVISGGSLLDRVFDRTVGASAGNRRARRARRSRERRR